jgi:hypothetical protein
MYKPIDAPTSAEEFTNPGESYWQKQSSALYFNLNHTYVRSLTTRQNDPVAASCRNPWGDLKQGGNISASKSSAKPLRSARRWGIDTVVFDRGGYFIARIEPLPKQPENLG